MESMSVLSTAVSPMMELYARTMALARTTHALVMQDTQAYIVKKLLEVHPLTQEPLLESYLVCNNL